jgi:hypothetical protein
MLILRIFTSKIRMLFSRQSFAVRMAKGSLRIAKRIKMLRNDFVR